MIRPYDLDPAHRTGRGVPALARLSRHPVSGTMQVSSQERSNLPEDSEEAGTKSNRDGGS